MESHLDGLARDLRYALRDLRKNHRFSLIAILALRYSYRNATIGSTFVARRAGM